MLTIPNIISLLRFPLAFLFLLPSPSIRAIAVIMALITDGLDGYIARNFKLQSRWGTLIDPLTDKFFVFFAMATLWNEQRLDFWEAVCMSSRDLSIIVFGAYLALKGHLGSYRFRAIWCGKVSTCMQLMVLLGLIFHITFPAEIYLSFVLIGFLALVELYYSFDLRTKGLQGP